MTTIKTSELTGAALDWAVAKCENVVNAHFVTQWEQGHRNYSTDWAQGGPIIEREWLNIAKHESGSYWEAASEKWMLTDGYPECGDTLLIAAMRCYVASKLGDTVDVPDELTA